MAATTDTSGGGRDGVDSPSPASARDDGPRTASRGPRGRRRRQRSASLPRALGLTLASALIPGTGHLAVRRRVAGALLLGSFLALVAAAVAVLVWVPRSELLQLAVDPRVLRYGIALAAALGAAWVLVVLSTYLVTRPRGLRGLQRVVGALVVAALSTAVATPFAFSVRTAYVQHDLISHVFGDNPQAFPGAGWGGLEGGSAEERLIRKPRVNVLLLGGDGGKSREGVRTDSMILASIDTRTGDTVLISLPRNLQHVRFPPGTRMAERFPNGFPDLLNAVYRYGEEHPEVVPDTRHRGAELLKQTFGHTVGLDIDYFVLVNLIGFRDIVNALGGVRINVERRLPVGGYTDQNGRVVVPPSRYIQPGPQLLNGQDALWYGRSRIGSDDYERMARQRCLLGAIARQADPLRVLTRFQQLASATKRIVLTDIPQEVLPELVQLAVKGKEAKITSLTFVRSARFHPHDPDFGYIRFRVKKALQAAVPAASPDPAANASPGGNTSGPKANPPASRNPADPSQVQSLDEVCSYS